MSLASIVSIERCTWIGTPLASSSKPTESPTISTWNCALAASPERPISVRAFITS